MGNESLQLRTNHPNYKSCITYAAAFALTACAPCFASSAAPYDASPLSARTTGTPMLFERMAVHLSLAAPPPAVCTWITAETTHQSSCRLLNPKACGVLLGTKSHPKQSPSTFEIPLL